MEKYIVTGVKRGRKEREKRKSSAIPIDTRVVSAQQASDRDKWLAAAILYNI